MYVYYINVCYIHFLDLYIERTIGNEQSSVDRYCDDTDAPFPLKSFFLVPRRVKQGCVGALSSR